MKNPGDWLNWEQDANGTITITVGSIGDKATASAVLAQSEYSPARAKRLISKMQRELRAKRSRTMQEIGASLAARANPYN